MTRHDNERAGGIPKGCRLFVKSEVDRVDPGTRQAGPLIDIREERDEYVLFET